MQAVVSFSGGRTSGYLVFLTKMLGMDVHYIFMDTGAEHPKTYEFIRKVVDTFGIDLICLRVKYNQTLGKGNDYEVLTPDQIKPDYKPWIGMVEKYGTPSAVSPYCTSRMKTEPHDKYCNDVYGKGNYTTWLGIRRDEPRRLKERDNVRYLAELSDFDKSDVLEWWANQSFNLEIPEHLGNCTFCIKKGLNKVALAAKDEPLLAEEFISVTEGGHVRTTGLKHNHKRMYRSSLHLSDVIKMYECENAEDMRKRLRNQKSFDSGSCSESCEVFS